MRESIGVAEPDSPEAATLKAAGPSRGRLLAAVAVAFAVDVIQGPTALAWLSGMGGPIEWVLNEGLDVVTMGLLTWLVGFHWAFLPAFIVESVPVADLAPTWTGSVMLARRKELRALFSRSPTVPAQPDHPAGSARTVDPVG
jgi:hypothetical protein